MKRLVLAAVALTASLSAFAQKGSVDYRLPEQQRWAAHAKAITITRDNWGIAHVHGKTDADAVFGMIYTQCEDDFNRVENNYLVSLGRLSEADGEAKLWQDLRQQLFIDPVVLKRDFNESPDWLKALMEAWADGANFYLAKHPEVKPRALTHFEPWMALSFTEGSIGGDIERVNLKSLEAFYSVGHGLGAITSDATQHHRDDRNATLAQLAQVNRDVEPGGSNGAAIAPSNTKDHHALLLINPHTSFFFRSELQMQSDEGLNAYGAVTWGQIFIYQGFNERAGWMHTSSNVDAIDEFEDTVGSKAGGGGFVYRYGNEYRPLRMRTITLKYKAADGSMKERSFGAYFDHRGPIIREEGGNKWVSIELMNVPVKALEQSFLRTKAHTYGEYKKTME
ncbi:MAG TPA: penicillin acylase family protein, partial [Terriglobus sp.]